MIYVLIPTTKHRRDRLRETLESLHNSDCPEPFTICVYENADGGWNTAAHKILEGITGLCWILSDDVLVEKDCLRLLSEAYHREFPDNDGLCQAYDNTSPEGMNATHPFAHTDVLKKYFIKGYKHYMSDIEIREVMDAKGKYKYVPEARLLHRNMYYDHKLEDETYRVNQTCIPHDKALYRERKTNGFPPNVL